jgi:hypothetical protein
MGGFMKRAVTSAAFAVALIIGGGASAGETPVQPPALTPEISDTSADAVLSAEEMDAMSGRQGVQVDVMTSQQITGSTSGNTITAETINTGDVSFSDGALGGFNGVGNFVINTGANNTLQGAINLSVVTTPAN